MQLTVFRIVVASPGDVQAERNVLRRVLDELNEGMAAERGLILKLWKWDTDAHPGFHPEGPQGVIDIQMKIPDCDLFIGIFWKRFGTPVADAGSGTEHEFRLAYESWRENRRPQIFFYFNQKSYTPQTTEEAQQWAEVLKFRDNFSKEGLALTYKGTTEFEALVRKNLTAYIRGLPPPAGPEPPAPPDEPARTGRVTPPEPPARAGGQPPPRRKLWRIAVPALLVIALLGLWLWPKKRDCGDIRTATCLKLDLATGASQEKCFVDGSVELTEADLKLQRLAGRATPPIPAQENGCPCKWVWGTDKSAFEIGPTANNCIFSFDLPDGVGLILLNLFIDGEHKVFTIHVRRSKHA